MNADHLQLIDDCEARESCLRPLTGEQVTKLEEIWERATARG
jgi:hypothetical protein